jgi:hypothetical protein
MRLAWFRSGALAEESCDEDTSALVAELETVHQLDRFDGARAHDFPWLHDRQPYDLCVYELADDDTARFIPAYALHYPGVLLLRTAILDDTRLLDSPLIVVHDDAIATRLRDDRPETRVRVVPTGVRNLADQGQQSRAAPDRTPSTPRVVVGVLGTSRPEIVERALQRVRDAGVGVDVMHDGPPGRLLAAADVLLALQWSGAPPTTALLGMAARKPVVVLETEATAAWPALDPQTWQPRGVHREGAAIVVSIDLRDEEHSLMLAIRRLAGDASLRATLGASAHAWWREHATVAHAVTAWERILTEAITIARPTKRHVADGTERARAILGEFGVSVDFLR